MAQEINWLDKITDWGWGLVTALVVLVAGWIARWKWKTDQDIIDLRLHVSEHYVKKADLKELKDEFAAEFAEVKGSQNQIIDLLLQRKIGTTQRR